MKRREPGRVMLVGFEGTQVNEQVRELLKFGVGGFVLFRRNLESAEQTAGLIAEIRSLAETRRLLFAIDEEGGRVQRLREFGTAWPPARVIGAAADAEPVRQFGAALGTELRALGFDIDFAPVVDVDSNAGNPVIGDRSFGSDPETVADLTEAFIRAIQGQGVAACAKHFPGHGDTVADSHYELPVVRHDRERLEQVEWVPFRRAVAAGVQGVMTAHLVAEKIDPATPATMSPHLLGLLRNEIGFPGVIFSDDLEMRAIADNYDVGEAALSAARAGCDMLLICLEMDMQEAVFRALYDGPRRGVLPAERMGQMEQRLDRLAAWLPVPATGDLSVVGCQAHRALSREIAARPPDGLTGQNTGSKQT
ncbi:MAG: beta-N-acetylhexosaminidase [Candidatus Lernaella stagnicola]|nr:beta-N-acetylhexosaminidase [Candidatus Lernaella stagnicola]